MFIRKKDGKVLTEFVDLLQVINYYVHQLEKLPHCYSLALNQKPRDFFTFFTLFTLSFSNFNYVVNIFKIGSRHY